MWGRFDRIYLVSGDCCHHRRQGVMQELDRVGIARHPGFTMLRGQFRSAHEAHERALLDFAHGKCGGTCLILEDDIRFLKDMREVERIVREAPPADIVDFDPFMYMEGPDMSEAKKIPFIRWTHGICGTSCYSVSKVAALCLSLSYSRHRDQPPDSALFLGHQDLRTAISTRHACVQLTFLECDNARKYGVDSIHKAYGLEPVDYALYAVPEGYGYGRVIDRTGAVI